MTRRAAGRRIAGMVSLLGAACAAAPAFAAKQPLPYHLAVSVDYGGTQGSESWRREIELALLDRLARDTCFLSVSRYEAGDARADLLELRITVRQFSEQTTWDVSMATLRAPDAPPEMERQRIVELHAELGVELRTLPEQSSLRQRVLALSVAHRPVLGEEPRLAARLALVEDVSRSIGGWTCKGSAKKLAASIARARSTGAPERDGAR